ncbi:MAG: hypothetical protein QG614_150 [Patescibacteria group bacterium]|nr:hypothetical protein [Patescibacteria group bacterium]
MDIRSVYNVGSIFRTAEGFGFEDFGLIGITPTPLDKHNNKRKDFVKTALGAEDRIKWEFFENTNSLFEQYKDYKIISLEINQQSEDIVNIGEFIKNNQEQNFLLFLGSEVDGVSKEILNISERVYHIPMKGQKESFNVSVAAGIILYILNQNKS